MLNTELTDVMPESTTLGNAFAYAQWLHHKQTRKTTHPEEQGIPYLTHLVDVLSLLIQAHATEDQLIAGLLHDAFEDVPTSHDGNSTVDYVRNTFGESVEQLILASTDGDEGMPRTSETWLIRKWIYLTDHAEIALRSPELLLVPLADKVANATSIVNDLHVHGDEVWSRFSVGRKESLWYYRENLKTFSAAFGEDHVLVARLSNAINAMSLGVSPEELSWNPSDSEIEFSRQNAERLRTDKE